MIKRLLLVGLVIWCSGCVSIGWKKIEPEPFVDKKRYFSAVLPQGWMRYEGDADFILSKDGVTLDAIYVSSIGFNGKLSSTKKVFLKEMLPYELAEVVIDNFKSATQAQKFEVLSNEAEHFAGKDAFKLSYRFQAIGGLWKRGLVYGFIYNNKVMLVQYEAAEQYYYDDNKAAFDAFVKRLTLD